MLWSILLLISEKPFRTIGGRATKTRWNGTVNKVLIGKASRIFLWMAWRSTDFLLTFLGTITAYLIPPWLFFKNFTKKKPFCTVFPFLNTASMSFWRKRYCFLTLIALSFPYCDGEQAPFSHFSSAFSRETRASFFFFSFLVYRVLFS